MILEEKLEIVFKNKKLLEMAVTHSSYANEHHKQDNERLEFLGDAVLELLMSEYLFALDSMTEGEMTKRRAQAVCEEALVKYAGNINLAECLLLGKGEEHNGGRERNAIIADAFEAVLGAVFLDQGFAAVRDVFYKIVIPNIYMVDEIIDYKSDLQEKVQADKRALCYEIVSEEGPAHNKKFISQVNMDGCVLGRGIGKTKKEAEQNAAKEALGKLAGDVK